MRLRQIALVAEKLEPAVSDLCAVLGVEVCFRDPGVAEFGLVNALMPIGDTFLEVVSPKQPDTTAGRLLARRGGDGGYMVILQTDDLRRARQRAAEHGVRIVWEIALPDVETVHLHPRDIGGAIVSLDEPRPPESWRWAGPDWQRHLRRDTVSRITGATLEARDPEAMAARWEAVLGLPRRGPAELALAGGALRFVPAGARGEGLRGICIETRDRARVLRVARERGLEASGDTIVACGTEVTLVQDPGTHTQES
jgi:hypothetical protein